MLMVLIAIYVITVIALHHDLILFASAPICGNFEEEEESWQMHSVRILYCFAVYMAFYLLQKKYVQEVAATDGFEVRPIPLGGIHDDNVKNQAKKTDTYRELV